jgi:hypothetical protein
VIAGVTVLVVPLAASPAAAWQPSGGYGYVYNARTRIGACDTAADNLGVTVWYASDNGTGGNVGDWNGSGGGCGEEGPDNGGRIIHYHVCVGTACGTEIYV